MVKTNNFSNVKILITILFFSLCNLHFTQSNFPTSWLGIYEGEMYMEDLNGINDTIPVEFHLIPTGVKNHWTHRMIYNSNKWGRLIKDYEIFWNDTLKNPNLFLLDEKDGIYIQEFFMNNRFYSHFEVEGENYVTLLEKKDKNLYFEIRCTSLKKGLKSKSQTTDVVKNFEVNNYYHYALQHVLLKPKKRKKR